MKLDPDVLNKMLSWPEKKKKKKKKPLPLPLTDESNNKKDIKTLK